MMQPIRRQMLMPALALLSAAAALCSCASNQPATAEPPPAVADAQREADQLGARQAAPAGDLAPAVDTREEIVERGSGVFVRRRGLATGLQATEAGDINLRFEAADIKEFIAIVLGDILGVNYLVDPNVGGQVTVHTSTPITVDQVLPLFEQILSLNGAALVQAGGLYQVVPSDVAASRDPLASGLPRGEAPGFRTQIIPLQYIAAEEMQTILESVVSDTDSIRVDPTRNLIIASGDAAEIQTILETIEIFDVDWLRGMSVGLYPLDNVDPRTLETELNQVLGEAVGQADDGVLGGIVRLVPLERLTSLLVVSSTPAALREVEIWIRRLDQPGESAGRRLYVYPVQNAKAIELADILGSIFGSRAAGRTAPSTDTDANAPRGRTSALAPGLTPVRIGAAPGGPGTRPVPETPLAPDAAPATSQTATAGGGAGLALAGSESIEIIADDVRNALVILASPQDYRMVESALVKLDVVPLQVLIEARILEVSLRNDLSYGVEWFFRNTVDGIPDSGTGTLDIGDAGIAALAPGFSYTVVDSAAQVRLAINMLEQESEINVLSSPSLMVLDNQTATINVGDEIPVPSRQSISNIDPSSPTVNEISFRQTGVTLTVTPRVNNSGLVTMEVRQEVATAATTTTSNIDAPTIQNRQIETVIAVNSGDTIVLGGLIQDQKALSENGVPFLRRMPVLGKLFGSTTDEFARTELLVLITPRIARDRSDARRITEEFRQKLQRIEDYENGMRAEPGS